MNLGVLNTFATSEGLALEGPDPFLLWIFILLGLIVCVYGILITVDPLKYSLKTVKETFLLFILGEKAYVFLTRFLGGPLCVLIGLLLMWHHLNELFRSFQASL